ncbi:MAG TPA: BMP family ABC transporter substrate-binding protein [Solirubrobacteraceae bacterium]|nr:BMP family ABC transporter substrate-binding protein [Solirubrobacteraceae bacterium]
MKHPLIRLLLIAALGMGWVAGCGSDDEKPAGGGAASTPAQKKIRVAMVTDIGGLNDRSFNALAYKGLQRAKAELGGDIRVVTSSKNADYVPNLSSLARQKYDLIVAVGFLMAEATDKVAKSFPNVNFAIIDFSQAGLKSKPANVQGLVFREQEAGYLAGYVAGLYVKDKGGDQVISSVGGQSIPPVDHYIAGYQAGAKKANPGVKTLNAYTEDFIDPAKCKELALNQIGEGSQVVFQVAGQCGLGALDAAKEKDVQGIGVDADQGYLGPQVMTSALKKIDLAVLQVVKDVQAGQFKKGTDAVFDLKGDGVGLGKLSPAAEPFKADVETVQQQIADGTVRDIPDEVAK